MGPLRQTLAKTMPVAGSPAAVHSGSPSCSGLGLRLYPKGESMFEIHREELDWAGRKLVLETGWIARQADGAVVATYGETTVLATVVSLKAAKPGVDFFPLTVNYQEKAFAAGRIPG